MSKVVCPYCFEVFKSGEVKFRCYNHSGSCPDVEDPAMVKFWGDNLRYKPVITPKKSIFGTMPKSAVCSKCNKETLKTICPHCHNELPREMVKKGGLIISIIGARSSGKTNYIAVLINELQRQGYLVNISAYPRGIGRKSDEDTEKRYKQDFYNVLYNNQQCPAQTTIDNPRSKVPLIYKLNSTNGKDHTYLVFYDTAGENFNDRKNIDSNVKFLKNSDGIIFLLDTFSVPYVHKQLKHRFNLNKLEDEYDHIVNNLLAYFDDMPDKSVFYSKPMALTFSKIDALLNNADLFGDTSLSGINIKANSEFLDGKGYGLEGVEVVDRGIRGGLDAWKGNDFIELIKSHKINAKYFGISALGVMPDNNLVKNIEPYRVMDPLMWILYQLKFPLKKRK